MVLFRHWKIIYKFGNNNQKIVLRIDRLAADSIQTKRSNVVTVANSLSSQQAVFDTAGKPKPLHDHKTGDMPREAEMIGEKVPAESLWSIVVWPNRYWT